jgi:type IV pilus assembly protein PilV
VSRATRRGAGGFSLVEVLVAMFVVALGILALAALLQVATRYGKMSELRSTATLLVNDIADRMRANRAGAALGAQGYDLATHDYPSEVVAPLGACTSATPCAPAALARSDMADWTARLRATLPSGSAFIRYLPGAGPATSAVDVWVGWTDPNSLASGAAGERGSAECPAAWVLADARVRCVALQVAL